MSTPPSWGIGRSRVAAVDHPNDPRGGMYCTTTGSGRGQRRDMVCLAEVGNGIEHQQRLDAGHERIHCCCTAADVGIDIGDDQLAASHRCIRSRRSVLTNAPYRSLREHGVHRPRSKSRHDSGVRWRTGEPGAPESTGRGCRRPNGGVRLAVMESSGRWKHWRSVQQQSGVLYALLAAARPKCRLYSATRGGLGPFRVRDRCSSDTLGWSHAHVERGDPVTAGYAD
ncbi:hypothetical protein MLGJGCBP_05036 [Rhodococcus sp. T7]|nr:hypothetical protein MLGJGCBP_05036 [Rhodococcus sp. T7]